MTRRMAEAIQLLVVAVNVLLMADGSTQRVTSNITITRRDGYTIIAFEEQQPGDIPPPIDLTHLRRDPARGG